MTYRQLVEPNPDIPCTPGWCLQYVRQAFGAPVVEPTATAGWANAKKRHEDWELPAGVAVPVWFSLANEPAGHVAIRMGDGSVYSTSSPYGNRATHHPDIADLIRAYSYNNPLTYLGWSEDISGVTVIEPAPDLAYQSIGETMALTPEQSDQLAYIASPKFKTDLYTGASTQEVDARAAFIGQILNHAVQVGDTDQTTNLGLFLRWYAAGLDNVYRAATNTTDTTTIATHLITALGQNLAADVVAEIGRQLATPSKEK